MRIIIHTAIIGGMIITIGIATGITHITTMVTTGDTTDAMMTIGTDIITIEIADTPTEIEIHTKEEYSAPAADMIDMMIETILQK